VLAQSLPSSRYPEKLKSDLQAEAMIVIANCRRLAADWKGSQAALAATSNLLDRGTGDPARQARFVSICASLATDTGRFETALGLLGRAAELYRSAQEPAGLSRVAVKEANTLLASFRHEEAITRAEQALAMLTPADTRLEMLARSIITESLIFLGRSSEALRSFVATRPIYEQLGGRRTRLKVTYLEALLLASLGCARESEKAFRDVIDGYIEEELFKDAFLSLLTYFETLVKRDALGKAKQVYKQAAELLSQAGTGSHEQMRQVWRQLLEKVEAESLKEYQLQEVRQYVCRHWNMPAARVPLGIGN
jgi:ATP/maltotriose-dependent transcriptional regulator MalT